MRTQGFSVAAEMLKGQWQQFHEFGKLLHGFGSYLRHLNINESVEGIILGSFVGKNICTCICPL